MQPGLPRAVPMGIVGFLLGAAFVILLRALQSVEPVWDAQLGLMMGAVISTVFFVWGIGAFNPKLSEHHLDAPEEFELVPAEGAHHDHHDEADDESNPFGTLSRQMWQVSFWLIVLMVGIFAFATIPGGFALQVSSDPLASRDAIGYFTTNIFGQEVVMSELTQFLILTAVILTSLGVVGGGIGLLFFRLSENVAEAKATPNIEALPAGSTVREVRERNNLRLLLTWIAAIVTFVVLYVLHYYVLVGLVLTEPEVVQIFLSFAASLTITLIIFQRRLVVRFVGIGARRTARVLRGLPAFLGQK